MDARTGRSRAVRVVVDVRARALGDAAVIWEALALLDRLGVRGRRARPEPEQADEQREDAGDARAGSRGCSRRSNRLVRVTGRARRSGRVARGPIARCWFERAPGFARGRGIFSGNGPAVGVFFFHARTRSASPLHQSQAVFASLVENHEIRRWENHRGDKSRQSVLIGETGR